jgi:Excreted virulence factor EspC, type VII ESX diderm
MTAPMIEVCPAALRRLAAGLSETAGRLAGATAASYANTAPDRAAGAGWRVTLALDGLVAAVEGGLRQLAGEAREVADGLRSAADAYEACDSRAAGR